MKVKLDEYEKEILDSYENEKWVEIPDMANKIHKHVDYAHSTLIKNKKETS